MRKISQMFGVVVVSLVLVGCATTTKLGSAGTLDAGFCMHDAPQWMAWLSCDEPLIDFKADILSTGEADEEPSEAEILGQIHITPTPAELSGHLPDKNVYHLDAFSNTPGYLPWLYQPKGEAYFDAK